MEPAATPVNQDVAMTGTDRTHFNRSILPVTGTSSGALSTHRSMPGRVPLLTATNPASIRRAQLPASSGLPSAGQQLRGPVMGPSAQGLFEEGQKMLESLGMVATSAWGPTQQPSNAFLQGLAAGAQLSHMLLNNAHSEGGRSSRHYRERDRQPRRDRRSRSPTTERPSAGPVRRSHDPSLPSTDRYRPTYGSIIPNVPEVEIKREASTEVGSLLGATPGVSASSSGTRSRRRSRSKPMPTNEKWDHDGFAQHYPSSPKKWDHDGFAQHYPSGPKK
ncbi:hypothetical protein QBC39DRAFT_357739 [Podospora conica]|nr:hypothetical protein QBC39DRAFT_357739 [Schizothecium conicum]